MWLALKPRHPGCGAPTRWKPSFAAVMPRAGAGSRSNRWIRQWGHCIGCGPTVFRDCLATSHPVAVRDRLNALLASMIHQAKHIVLHDLRELDDGTFAATVTVNGQALVSDPILVELREGTNGTIR